jgi:hypothetical protein
VWLIIRTLVRGVTAFLKLSTISSTSLGELDSFLFRLVVCFDHIPDFGDVLAGQGGRRHGDAVDQELLHPVVHERVVADDLHDQPDQRILGLFHDRAHVVDRLSLDLLPFPQYCHHLFDSIRTFLLGHHALLCKNWTVQ